MALPALRGLGLGAAHVSDLDNCDEEPQRDHDFPYKISDFEPQPRPDGAARLERDQHRVHAHEVQEAAARRRHGRERAGPGAVARRDDEEEQGRNEPAFE